MIKISKRLEAIASLTPCDSKVIDIGCDHGLLDIYLYQNKISKKIIASDVNKNALNNAKQNLKKHQLEPYLEARLGNGLDTLKKEDETNTIIISGMGAHTIIDILNNGKEKLNTIDTIIIQSNTKIELLRKKIADLNFYIDDEELLEENKKIYTIIKFKKGKIRYNKKQLYFGPILLDKNSELFRKTNALELQNLKKILEQMPLYKIIDRYKIKKRIQLYK